MVQEQVIIDRQKCTGCGICISLCPYQVISLRDGRAEHSGAPCFFCDHCRAACPAGAIDLVGLGSHLGLCSMEEKVNNVPPGAIDATALVALMRSRRSCRKYLEKAVPLEMLLDLVKIGTTAPSGTNSQGWNFVVLPGRQDTLLLGGMVAEYYRRLNRLAANPLLRFVVGLVAGDGLSRYYRNYYASVVEALRGWDEEGVDRLFHGAVAAILVTGRKTASCPAEDALLATQNILLAAHAMGLGSCLIGFGVEAMRRAPKIKQQMHIGDDEEIYSVIALGFPAISYLRPAGRRIVEPRIIRSASSA
jgi:nitroreductase/NAD-dependent dihydropyrimidine dehydrogenase PreA subunit